MVKNIKGHWFLYCKTLAECQGYKNGKEVGGVCVEIQF